MNMLQKEICNMLQIADSFTTLLLGKGRMYETTLHILKKKRQRFITANIKNIIYMYILYEYIYI